MDLEAARRRIGTNIARLREAAGTTQTQFANALDVDLRHLKGVEAGSRSPSLALLVEVAIELRVDLADLFKATPARARRPGRPKR